MKSLNEMQDEQYEWSMRNFGPQSAMLPLLGVVEELGELAHAVLKREQGIRKDENHLHNEKDAIGDVCIYLMDYCNRRGFNLLQIVNTAWEEVRERDMSEGGGLLARQRDDGTWVYVDPTGSTDGPADAARNSGDSVVDAADGGRAGATVSSRDPFPPRT